MWTDPFKIKRSSWFLSTPFFFLPPRYEQRPASPQSQFLSPGGNLLPGGDLQPRPSSAAASRPRFPWPAAGRALSAALSPAQRSASPRRGRALLLRAEAMTARPAGLKIPRRGRAKIGPEQPQLPGLSRRFPHGRKKMSTATHRPSPLSPDGQGAAPC